MTVSNDRVAEGEMLCESACETGVAVRVAFGELAHRGRFVHRNSGQASAEKEALQVPGAVTDLENPGPFDERDNFQDPVFPMTE